MPCPEALMMGENNTGVFVPSEIAVCPECGNAVSVPRAIGATDGR